MIKPNSLTWLLFAGLFLLVPAESFAQYKNSSFGIDLGGWLLTKPSIQGEDGGILSPDNRPLRINHGLRVGLENNYKMNDDHFWFIIRGNLGLMQFNDSSETTPEALFDTEANRTLGTLLGFQGSIGVRYYLLTDYIKPYIQGSLSYLRLMTFTATAEESCNTALLACSSGTNSTNYLPHPNVGAIHVQPGLEWIFTRDIALNIFLDYQRWLIFNADDNNTLVIGLGFNFYT